MAHPTHLRSSSRSLVVAAVLALLLLSSGGAAWACGGLISPTGAVQLQRTSTLVSYSGGVEHYVTSFAFGGIDSSFGSITPLPDVPTLVERGGDWTLQRAQIEVGQRAPEPRVQALEDDEFAEEAGVEILQETRIDSLEITILRGGGDEVARWAGEQGFVLSDDAPEVLRFYADRSPVFMAARFDAGAAANDGFREGDGIPIHLEIPTDDPWVPLRILALGKPDGEIVEADVFLLTPEAPRMLTGDGVELRRTEFADPAFLADLRSDERSTWVPREAWFSHVVVDGPAGGLRTDLAINAFGGEPDLVDAGLAQALSPRDVEFVDGIPLEPIDGLAAELPRVTVSGLDVAGGGANPYLFVLLGVLGGLAGAAVLAAAIGLATQRPR